MKLPTFDSMTSCNAATGIPMPVLRAAKRAGCEAFDSHSRVNLELLLRWLYRPDADKDGALTDWHARFKRAQALAAEMELSKERGELVDAKMLLGSIAKAGAGCRSIIDQAVQNAPPTLAGADLVDVRIALRDILDELLIRMRDAFSEHIRVVDEHTHAATDAICNPIPDENKTNETPSKAPSE